MHPLRTNCVLPYTSSQPTFIHSLKCIGCLENGRSCSVCQGYSISSAGWKDSGHGKQGYLGVQRKTALAHILVLTFSSVTWGLGYWTLCYILRWNGTRSLGLYMLLSKCLEQCLVQNTSSVILAIHFHFLFPFFFFFWYDKKMDSFMCGKSGSTDQFPIQNPKLHRHKAAAPFSSGS